MASGNNGWFHQPGDVTGVYCLDHKSEKWSHYSTSYVKGVSSWKIDVILTPIPYIANPLEEVLRPLPFFATHWL